MFQADTVDVAKSYYPNVDGSSLLQPMAGSGVGGYDPIPRSRPVWGRRNVVSPLNQAAGAWVAGEGARRASRSWLKRRRRHGTRDVAYGLGMSGRSFL